MKTLSALWCVMLAAACAQAGPGSESMSVSLVGGAPSGKLGVDVYVDISPSDTWTAAGIRAVALNGAFLRYAQEEEDLRGGPDITNPGLGDLFVCSISKPLVGNTRFTNGAAAIAGAYAPTSPVATLLPGEFNTAFFASPPASSTTPSADGYIARLGLDVSGVGIADPVFEIFTPGSEPAGWIPILLSEPPDPARGQSPGSVFATFDVPQIRGINWGVYAMRGDGQVVPLPGAAAMGLAGLGLVCGVRRRS